jgi:DNA-directed RNA polymerase specialized sigma24 family protein
MITDFEYEEALNDPDNIAVMNSACVCYQRLGQDTLENCRLHGLYRCLETHDDTLGSKFTSSLFQHVIWQCQQAVNEQQRMITGFELTIDPQVRDNSMASVMVDDCLSVLSDRDAEMVRDRYLYSMTLGELAEKYDCSRMGAKFIVEKSLETMRESALGV